MIRVSRVFDRDQTAFSKEGNGLRQLFEPCQSRGPERFTGGSHLFAAEHYREYFRLEDMRASGRIMAGKLACLCLCPDNPDQHCR